MALTLEKTRARIDAALDAYRSTSRMPKTSLLPANLTTGKMYEAWVLASVLEHLRNDEGYAVLLRQSTKVALKSSPGPINRAFPYFELSATGLQPIEVWTDVEFLALSWSHRHHGGVTRPGDYHELDIVAVDAGVTGRPRYDEILLGVECKNTGYTKDLLRGILGVRRELSLLQPAQPTRFARWPRASVAADPPSCLMVCSTDPAVVNYADPGRVFGIDIVFDPLP